MAVEVQVAQGEQAATEACRAPSARRGAHPPSRVSAPPSSLLLTQPAHISVPPHPRALVRAPASTLTTSPAPPTGSMSPFTLSCNAAPSEETSLTPPRTHSLSAQDPLIPHTHARNVWSLKAGPCGLIPQRVPCTQNGAGTCGHLRLEWRRDGWVGELAGAGH